MHSFNIIVDGTYTVIVYASIQSVHAHVHKYTHGQTYPHMDTHTYVHMYISYAHLAVISDK